MKKKTPILLLIISCFLTAESALGSNAPSVTNIEEVFGEIGNWLFRILLAVAGIMIIIGGFTYATAGGDEGKIRTAKNTVLYALIGIAVAVVSKTVVTIIQSAFGP